MPDKAYNSGHRLRALREVKGLKETEFAEAINCSLNEILIWEEDGIPEKNLQEVLDFFEISKSFFSIEIASEKMLERVVNVELGRSNLDEDLANRIEKYKAGVSYELDLSSLGLVSVPNEVFFLSELKKLNLSDNLLTTIDSNLKKLINSGCQIIIRNNFLDPSLETIYNASTPDKESEDQQGLFKDSIKLIQLRLENIGIYNDLTINFDDSLTVLIGVNGAGKTTILKALSLAILGPRDTLYQKAALLRGIDTPSTEDSRITLRASLEGVEYSNIITLSHESDTGETLVTGLPFEPLYDTESSLKNLILCLGEQRNSSDSNTKKSLEKQPRVLDLLPLLLGEKQSCLQGFTSWWANLENSKLSNPDDQSTIDLCFKVFSRFMNEDIQSAGLKKVQPKPELWVKYENGKLIPFDLASQGYQAVMGWVGFIIQRMVEANEGHPLPLSQPSIVIIDEIDQLLSVKWQKSILSILREFFPNTQWVISTHSPMVLTNLDKHQVVQLHERDGQIIAESNEVDLWMWGYGDIIRRYFEISTTPPKFQEKELIEQIEQAKNSGKDLELEVLKERLDKVRASLASVDEFEEQLQSLREREEQLIELMKKLNTGKI